MTPDGDGFGQSLLDDLRFFARFARLRRRPLDFRAPSVVEAAAIDADPLRGRFGDVTLAVDTIDGRAWSIRERDWAGWPDPPRFVLIALEPDGEVWCAKDFHAWPRPWTIAGVRQAP